MDKPRSREAQFDDDAFARCFHQYKNLVYKTALLLLDSSEDADDVLQEVFVQVYRQRHQYDSGRGAVSTWIYRITVNQCNSRRRKAVWRARIDAWLGRGIENSNVPAPDERLDETAIRIALRQMNDKLRTVLVLRFYNDLTYREIADVLNIPEGTAKSRVNFAIATLRERLLQGQEELRVPSQEVAV